MRIIPIVFSSNKKYTKCLFTTILSILDHSSDECFYKFFVLHKEIDDVEQGIFHSYLNKSNSEVEFINVTERVKEYDFKVTAHFTEETFFRFLIPEILVDYSKVVYLDCDIIVCHDIVELFDTDLEESTVAASNALGIVADFYNEKSDTRKYLSDVLNINDPIKYFQAGVMVIDIDRFRKEIPVKYLLDLATKNSYRLVDQDILSMFLQEKYKRLEVKWNLPFDCEFKRRPVLEEYLPSELLSEYTKAREDPHIVHYAGGIKPWDKPGQDFGNIFWEVARRSPYYEEFLTEMFLRLSKSEESERETLEIIRLQNQVNALENSTSYRLGNFFVRGPHKILSWIKGNAKK